MKSVSNFCADGDEMADEIIILVTAPASESEKLARVLVEERLAACVNIIDSVRSIYMWQGDLCNETEQLLVIKSVRVVWEKLCARIEQLHPYEVPEIIALPIQAGHRPYLDWLNAAISQPTTLSKGSSHASE
jgi:periplasmic divalent cation tolerance protein